MENEVKSLGNFAYFKALPIVSNCHWKNSYRDVKRYMQGCTVCQQKKDHIGKNLKNQISLAVPGETLGITNLFLSSISPKLRMDTIALLRKLTGLLKGFIYPFKRV